MNAIRIHLSFLTSLTAIIFLSACADSPGLNALSTQNSQNLNNQNDNNNGGCSSEDPSGNSETCPVGGGTYGTDVISYTQADPSTTNPKVDILFVVDSSGSLNSERQYIANALAALVGTFPVPSDFRVAVMLAHIGQQWSGKLYRDGSEPAVLGPVSPTMPLTTIQNLLHQKMSDPDGEQVSDGGEAGILSLTNGLTGDLLAANRAQGFFREDAALAVIFVADENDVCYPGLVPDMEYPNEYNAFHNYCAPNGTNLFTAANLYQKLLSIQGGRPLSVSGVLYTGQNGPVAPLGEDELGLGYLDVLNLVDNGYRVDLTDPAPDLNGPGVPDPVRITAGLVDIGDALVTSFYAPKITFLLTHAEVDVDTIVVKVNGTVIPHTYLSGTNAVRILESDAGGPGAVVTITYQYLL